MKKYFIEYSVKKYDSRNQSYIVDEVFPIFAESLDNALQTFKNWSTYDTEVVQINNCYEGIFVHRGIL